MSACLSVVNSIVPYINESEEEFKDIGLDWLSFTFLPEDPKRTTHDLPLSDRPVLPIDLFWELFGSDFKEFCFTYGEELGHGKHYYSRCMVVKCPAKNEKSCKGYSTDFQILYCVPDDKKNKDHAYTMGVNVSIPSHFLRAFFKLIGFDFDDLKTFFRYAVIHNIKFSRIDICWDDYSMRYTPHDYELDWHLGNIVSHYQKHNWYESEHSQGGTFVLGSRETKLLRIYDKNFESNGAIPAVRYEFMYTGKWARALAAILADNDLRIDFKSLIMDWFKVVGDYMKFNLYQVKADAPIRADWLQFLKDMFSEELQTVKVRPKSTKDFKRINHKYMESVFRWYHTFVTLFGQDIANNELAEIRGKPDNYTPSLVQLYNSYVVSTIYS